MLPPIGNSLEYLLNPKCNILKKIKVSFLVHFFFGKYDFCFYSFLTSTHKCEIDIKKKVKWNNLVFIETELKSTF